MIKAIFLDIDGTLVSFKTHRVPKSAAEAIHRVRQMGIKVFIATGRPRPFVNNLGDLEFDGIISVNGASVELSDGTHLVCDPVPQDDVLRMIEYQHKHPLPVAYVSHHDGIISLPDEHFYEVFQLLDIPNPPISAPEDALKLDKVMQVIAFFGPEDEPRIMSEVLTGCGALRWHPYFVDCIVKGADKASGIDAVCRHFGIDLSETMAFGDGGNDTGMLAHVGWGVAMGNAPQNVQQVARLVTTSVDDDGIANILNRIEEF